MPGVQENQRESLAGTSAQLTGGFIGNKSQLLDRNFDAFPTSFTQHVRVIQVVGHPLAVFRAARTLGLRIPDELSLVAFDDSDWTGVSFPGITVMSQRIHAIGAEAARLLIRRIARDGAPPVHRVVDQELIERGSIGSVPVPPRLP